LLFQLSAATTSKGPDISPNFISCNSGSSLQVLKGPTTSSSTQKKPPHQKGNQLEYRPNPPQNEPINIPGTSKSIHDEQQQQEEGNVNDVRSNQKKQLHQGKSSNTVSPHLKSSQHKQRNVGTILAESCSKIQNFAKTFTSGSVQTVKNVETHKVDNMVKVTSVDELTRKKTNSVIRHETTESRGNILQAEDILPPKPIPSNQRNCKAPLNSVLCPVTQSINEENQCRKDSVPLPSPSSAHVSEQRKTTSTSVTQRPYQFSRTGQTIPLPSPSSAHVAEQRKTTSTSVTQRPYQFSRTGQTIPLPSPSSAHVAEQGKTTSTSVAQRPYQFSRTGQTTQIDGSYAHKNIPKTSNCSSRNNNPYDMAHRRYQMNQQSSSTRLLEAAKNKPNFCDGATQTTQKQDKPWRTSQTKQSTCVCSEMLKDVKELTEGVKELLHLGKFKFDGLSNEVLTSSLVYDLKL
jgi:hypothetical protein